MHRSRAYFTRYLPTFNETVQPYGTTELVFGGNVISQVVGPSDEAWDGIGLVGIRASKHSRT